MPTPIQQLLYINLTRLLNTSKEDILRLQTAQKDAERALKLCSFLWGKPELQQTATEIQIGTWLEMADAIEANCMKTTGISSFICFHCASAAELLRDRANISGTTAVEYYRSVEGLIELSNSWKHASQNEDARVGETYQKCAKDLLEWTAARLHSLTFLKETKETENGR